ncbi:MAG: site-2 protease family protein [Acidimicrobiales bacterium]
MRDSIHLGTIRGIPIGMHWSVLLIAGLILWGLATEGLPTLHEGHSSLEYWIAATLVTVAFFACLLLHELGHALVAVRLGTGVSGITLWLFGGVSKLSSDNPSAGAELKIGIAGPLVSLGLGVAFLAAAAGLEVLAPSALAVTALAWLGVINLVLGVFNLLPAYPLDGGRVLRAALWAASHDRLRATEQAAAIGAVVAYAMVAAGLAMVLVGLWINGIWFALIGWFVRSAGRNEAAMVRRAEEERRGPIGPTPLRGPELRDALGGAGS